MSSSVVRPMSAQYVLDAWLAALNAGDLESLAALYDEDASLLPTFSPNDRCCVDCRQNYFAHLAERTGLRVEFDLSCQSIHEVGGMVTVAGRYTWTDDESGAVLARYTYVLDLNAERPILHHHSSLVPE